MPTITLSDTRKTCSKCREVKPRTEYQSDRSKRDGLSAQCKSCKNLNRKRWSEKNREREHETKTAYRNTDGKHIKWEARYRRRCAAFGVEPTIKSFTKAQLIEAYGDACVDCAGPWTDLEHVVPVSAGGEHSLDNCRPLCSEDNRRRWHECRSIEVAA